MATRDASGLAEGAWRFAAQIYLSTLLFTLTWKLARGDALDPWTLAWLGGCLVGFSVPQFLPWDRRPDLALHLNILGATVVQAVYVGFFYTNPVLMIIPCFGSLFVATTQRWPWIFYQMAPGVIVLAVVATDRNGLRVGLADTFMYGQLWASVGLISGWMRRHVDEAADELLAAQAEDAARLAAQADERAEVARSEAEALEHQAALAASLQSDITEVAGASAGIEEQSNAIASSVEEMATSVRETSNTADRAEASLRQISAAMTESEQSIARLDTAGKEIVGIVDTITELSEQTNLLALNATIEAARAGDAGKGFAVVANEVKDLAQRTAKSASGIAQVVDQIQQRLDQSTDATAAIAGLVATLEADQLALTSAMSQQTQVIDEISAASASSASGVSGIGEALRRLDQAVAELGSDRARADDVVWPTTTGPGGVRRRGVPIAGSV
ncbi:MAG: methyl-accepting chemotaxis protein [Actinomycetota bacterium]